ncbi:nucleoside-diphosphate kinase [Micromonospora sp. NPDC005171]|uniref:nucleoside-diphosphate kinase n=1 Tax=Micromonospora sp. NPDC005171 TaxID=3156866 RepID=UPI0033BB8093
MYQRTLILLKPDAYRRSLVGTILARFEQAGLHIEAIRVSEGEDETIEDHYPRDQEWLRSVGGKTLDDHRAQGLSPLESLGTEDALQIGEVIRLRLVDFLRSGPVVPAVLSGNRVIEVVRKLVGNTLPVLAAPGTIRGDFASDSTDMANAEQRPVANLIHASGDPGEAEREINLWFPRLK